MVVDLSPISKLKGLQYINLDGVHASDFRPLLDLPEITPDYPISSGRSLSFKRAAACADAKIEAASQVSSEEARIQALVAHLRTLPPWPEPLPQDIPPRPADPDAISPPEQDPDLKLVWGENGFDFFAAQAGRDPIVDAALEELRQLLETLLRKGNAHDDLYARARKALTLLDTDLPDALKLHIQYQALMRLHAGADARQEKFDDETVAALASLRDVVPGITLTNPDVLTLIGRQEADRTATPFGVDPARERAVLDRMADKDAPFAPAVRDAAVAAADPDRADRLTSLRRILSRNGMIAMLKLGARAAVAGVIGTGSWQGLTWAVSNADTLTSLALSLGDDIYWWARTMLDRIRALLEVRAAGP
ncbi:hypothetical protein JDO7802_03070 [Jannaschia donghaensis]|uniref:Uncharacterized protein n=2 Tax=Jannaschia donghaensis TaxID=420998 RepID=A0A0M6YPU7_9RHOB|nr:hypothetical protein JDO7802_03070 [Jannaschia donghaensis]